MDFKSTKSKPIPILDQILQMANDFLQMNVKTTKIFSIKLQFKILFRKIQQLIQNYHFYRPVYSQLLCRKKQEMVFYLQQYLVFWIINKKKIQYYL